MKKILFIFLINLSICPFFGQENDQKGIDILNIYQMRDKVKEKKKEENYTVDRMYATLNDGDVMLIQNYVFNKLLITINELKEQ